MTETANGNKARKVTIQKIPYKRQKLLLALLQAFGGKLNMLDLQKYLFLYTQICEEKKSYEFVPYKFGCFSFQSYADRRKLIDVGAVENSDSWNLTDSKEDYMSMVSKPERKKLELFASKFSKYKGQELVREVYKRYPYYAIKSEIAEEILNEEDMQKVEKNLPDQREPTLFTIGYEGASFEDYLNRLIKNNIKILCDVRKNPLSRKYGFSKSTLQTTLEKLNIKYVHIPELGITSDKRQTLNTQQDYDRLFDGYEKTTLANNELALDKVHALTNEHGRLAITCFEATQCMCHRGRVAKALESRVEWEYPIIHI